LKEKGDGKGLRRRAKGGKGGKRATGPEDEKEEEAHDETQVTHNFIFIFIQNKHEAAISFSPLAFLFMKTVRCPAHFPCETRPISQD
jgi:hypothetical protein